jgi:hypothetical protein
MWRDVGAVGIEPWPGPYSGLSPFGSGLSVCDNLRVCIPEILYGFEVTSLKLGVLFSAPHCCFHLYLYGIFVSPTSRIWVLILSIRVLKKKVHRVCHVFASSIHSPERKRFQRVNASLLLSLSLDPEFF